LTPQKISLLTPQLNSFGTLKHAFGTPKNTLATNKTVLANLNRVRHPKMYF